MISDNKKNKHTNRLSRITGQISGIQRIIEADEYCIAILMQIAAVNGALDKVGQIILESHLNSCVTSAMKDGSAKQRREKLDALLKVFSKYARIAT